MSQQVNLRSISCMDETLGCRLSVLNTPPSLYLVDCEDYQVELTKGLSLAWATARSEIVKAQLHQKKQYDRKAKRVDYREGTQVMVLMPQATTTKLRKLALPYHD